MDKDHFPEPFRKSTRGQIEVCDRGEMMQMLSTVCAQADWGRIMILLPTRRQAQQFHRQLQALVDRPVQLIDGPSRIGKTCVAVCSLDYLHFHNRKRWRMLLLPDADWASQEEPSAWIRSLFSWRRYVFVLPDLDAGTRERLVDLLLPVIHQVARPPEPLFLMYPGLRSRFTMFGL